MPSHLLEHFAADPRTVALLARDMGGGGGAGGPWGETGVWEEAGGAAVERAWSKGEPMPEGMLR